MSIAMTFSICSLLLLFILYKSKISFQLQLLFVLSFIIDFLVILMLPNEGLYFTDGIDFYNAAMDVLSNNYVNIQLFLDFQKFIAAADSWHFTPVWVFALVLHITKTPVCIAIIHVFLMKVSILLWYFVLKYCSSGRVASIAAIFMLFSLYLKLFSVIPLKDPLVFFLSSVGTFGIVKLYFDKKLAGLFIALLAFALSLITRIYVAGGFTIVLAILMYDMIARRSATSAEKNKKRGWVVTLAVLVLVIFAYFITQNSILNSIVAYTMNWIQVNVLSGSFMALILRLLLAIPDIYFAPYFFNSYIAQPVYLPAYFESFVRLLLIGFAIKGVKLIYNSPNRRFIFIVMVIPLLINMLALEVQYSSSSIRQYMTNYPLICFMLAMGLGAKFTRNQEKE